jgi:hypothetical protein
MRVISSSNECDPVEVKSYSPTSIVWPEPLLMPCGSGTANAAGG